jgi:sarcosine oxidase subunit alpha
LRNGRARHGETLRLVDHVRQVQTFVAVTDPVFMDKTGGRARG